MKEWIFLALEVIGCVLFWKFFMPEEYSKQEKKRMRKEKWERMTTGEFIARFIFTTLGVLYVAAFLGIIC